MTPPLTKEEKAAIAALKRLSKTWPSTLLLFAKVGAPSLTLSVRKPDSSGKFGLDSEVDWISGISAVGGSDPDIDPGSPGVPAALIPPPVEPTVS
jgi:hypothetical protein